MKIAFTGVREISGSQLPILESAIQALPQDTELFISGGQYGVDVNAAFLAMQLFPDAKHLVIVPAAYHDYDSVVQLMHQGADIGHVGSYRQRNQAMVDRCDELVAFPGSSQEVVRSGTWMTIRMARKAGKPVRLHPLT